MKPTWKPIIWNGDHPFLHLGGTLPWCWTPQSVGFHWSDGAWTSDSKCFSFERVIWVFRARCCAEPRVLETWTWTHVCWCFVFFGSNVPLSTNKNDEKKRVESHQQKTDKKRGKNHGTWVVRYIRMWESRSMRSQLELSGTLSQGQRTEPLAAGAPQRWSNFYPNLVWLL